MLLAAISNYLNTKKLFKLTQISYFELTVEVILKYIYYNLSSKYIANIINKEEYNKIIN